MRRIAFSALAVALVVLHGNSLGLEPLFSIPGKLLDTDSNRVLLQQQTRERSSSWPRESAVVVYDLDKQRDELRITSQDVLAQWPELSEDSDTVNYLHGYFGKSAQFAGDTLLIGSPGSQWICDCVEDPGIAVRGRPGKVFGFDGRTGAGRFAQIGPPPSTQPDNYPPSILDNWIEFGSVLSFFNETVFAGRRGFDIHTLQETVRLPLQEREPSLPPGASGFQLYNDDFTGTLAANGELILIQRKINRLTSAGDVGMYDFETGEFSGTIVPQVSQTRDYFGQSMAIEGEVAIIGAPGAPYHNATEDGAAYLFDLATGEEMFRFTAPDSDNIVEPTRGNQFGRSVALHGDFALVGSSLDSSTGHYAGAAYLFDAKTGELLQSFLAPLGESFFGSEVALTGNYALIGTGDATYVYAIPEPSMISLVVMCLGMLIAVRNR